MDFNCFDFLIPILIMIIICGCLGFLISLFSKLFYINENEKVEEIYKMLPGYNCGACGYVSCEEMAKAILEGEVKYAKACKVITDANAESLKAYCKTIKDNKGNVIDLK